LDHIFKNFKLTPNLNGPHANTKAQVQRANTKDKKIPLLTTAESAHP